MGFTKLEPKTLVAALVTDCVQNSELHLLETKCSLSDLFKVPVEHRSTKFKQGKQ